jgi:hypothetical protein
MKSQRPRWYQFGLRFLAAVILIGAVVALGGYAWQQRREASAALQRADQMVRSADAVQVRGQRTVEQLNYEHLIFYHLLGVRSLSNAEYAEVVQGLKSNPNAQKVVREYEGLSKPLGERVPPGQRNYPGIVTHLVYELQQREKQLVDSETRMEMLREERDRFRQDAEQYRSKCQELEKTIDGLRSP